MKKIIFSVIGLSLMFGLATTAMADTIVSDTNVNVYVPLDHYAVIDSVDWTYLGPAVATWVHSSWPTITGATWISSAYNTENPRPDSWRLFSDVIELPFCVTNIIGSISVTSDNAEEVYLNGTLIGSDGEIQGIAVDNQEWNTILDYPLTGLHAGTNVLNIIVRNYAYNTDSSTVNPAGLIYKAEITYEGADSDGDGVCDSNDKCSTETVADEISQEQGTNRWIWDGSDWITETPKGKGPTFKPDMDYTYGCSCTQILDLMKEATGFNFGGHYKFGCSKSILEDWNISVEK